MTKKTSSIQPITIEYILQQRQHANTYRIEKDSIFTQQGTESVVNNKNFKNMAKGHVQPLPIDQFIKLKQ